MSVFVLIPLGFVVVVALITLARERAYKHVQGLFSQNKPEEVLTYLDAWWVKFCFPSYNLNMLRFNAFILEDNVKRAKEVMGELLRGRCSKPQRADLLPRAFDFYLENDGYKQARIVLDEIRSTSTNPLFVDACQQAYDIRAEKSFAYIAPMEAALDGATPNDQMRLLHLLSIQYDNKGDRKTARQYQDRMKALVENIIR